MVYTSEHCVHLDWRREDDGSRRKVEYCCWCGQEQEPVYTDTWDGHGKYLRTPMTVKQAMWQHGCPEAPLPRYLVRSIPAGMEV